MRNLRVIHIFLISILLLELAAYFVYANEPMVGQSLGEELRMDVKKGEEKSGTTIVQDNNCISYPNQTKCANYTMPTSMVISDVESLCTDMPHMAGCSVHNLCESHEGSLSHDIYCTPFSILKDICTSDMSMMSGCHNYTSMCAATSVVQECDTDSLPLPTDSELSQLITSICKSMPMTECKQCNLFKLPSTRSMSRSLNCDLLLVYSNLCLSMPDMPQCHAWSKLCTLIPEWPICPSGDGNQDPIMRMYFHTGLEDYVLLKQWVPRNWWEYLCTFIAIVALGVFYEGLKTLRSILEERWGAESKAASGSIQDDDDGGHVVHTGWKFEWVPFRWSVDVPRALFVFVEIGVGLVLMLVAMTFNVGLFLAVCCGGLVGSLIFGRLSARFTKALCH